MQKSEPQPDSPIIPPRSNFSMDQIGDIAFLVISIAGYTTIFGDAESMPTGLNLIAVTLITIAYVAIGTAGRRYLEKLDITWLKYAFFAVEILLGGAMVYLGGGNIWMALLPIVSIAVFFMSIPGVIIVSALLILTIFVPMGLNHIADVFSSSGLGLLASVVFVALFSYNSRNEMEARDKIEVLARELTEANQKLREYSTKVEDLAITQERNRLAREIHDSVGHYLTSINIQIKAAGAVMDQDPGVAKNALGKAQSLAEEALKDVRRSVAALRAGPIANQPLDGALAMLVEEMCTAGFDTALEVTGATRPLSSQMEYTFYRAAQEGLTNARKHSQAAHIRVKLDFSDPQRAVLSICDDGQGSEKAEGGFGLLGLHERATLMGGSIHTETSPGQGFTLRIELPG